jgi:CDP-diglyceride synthetase
MIKRIITAIVCMALFIGLFILFPKFAIPFLSILISVIASHELIKAFQKVQIKPLKIIIYISCLYTVALFTVYLLSGNSGLDKMLGSESILAGLFLVVFISFLGMIFKQGTYSEGFDIYIIYSIICTVSYQFCTTYKFHGQRKVLYMDSIYKCMGS